LLKSSDIEFVGEIADADKSKFLGEAAALLFPINWPEPFGLVMIEAMACGTPVLAFRRGSVAEVIDEGVTGFVVDDIESGIATIPSLLNLDRWRVRQRFEERFTAARMAESYVSLYSRAFASYGRAAKIHTEDTIAPSIETVVN
jgi:glycosyltransferase involved in cell wall biosynthesis